VALQHAEIALGAGDDHHVDVFGADEAFGRDEFEVERHYAASAARRWPFRPLPRCRRPCRRRFGKVVVFAVHDRLERADRVLDGDELAGDAGEDFGDVERLRQEALDLAGAADGELILFGQLVHARGWR
jgi:hypothetical protein